MSGAGDVCREEGAPRGESGTRHGGGCGRLGDALEREAGGER